MRRVNVRCSWRFVSIAALSLLGAGETVSAAKLSPMDFKEACAASDAVFIGRVVDIQRSGAPVPGGRLPREGTYQVMTTVQVVKVFKGDVPQTAILKDSNAGFNALPPYFFYPFVQGEQYLIYARKDGEYFTTSERLRTRLLKDAAEDLEALAAES